MFKIFKALIIIIVTAAAAALLIGYFSRRDTEVTVAEGRIAGIESMARLCVTDIYSEVPVLDTINRKVLFGIQKQRGSISFDVERLDVASRGDTLTVTLPPEIIEIYESTDDNSWDVVDTKSLELFGSDKLSAEEENMVKSRIRERSIRLLYDNGTVKRARAEGSANLRKMLENVYHRPVIVTDPTPEGIRH